MRQLLSALLSGLILITGLIIVSIPASRDVVPGIRNYFSLQTGIWQNARNAEYPSDMVIQARNTKEDIIIRRDGNGVPHIHANTLEDASFALGYITAYDRYFQMRINARTVEGRLAEWLGDGYINTDRAFLNLGLDDAAWRGLNSLNDEDYAHISSYSNGVNTFINQHFASLKPIEFKILNLSNNYWRPVDGLRVAMLFGYHLTYSESGVYHQKIIDDRGEQFFRDMFMRNFPGDDLQHGNSTTFSRIANQQISQTTLDVEAAITSLENWRSRRHRIPTGRDGSMNMQSIVLDRSRADRSQPLFALDVQSQATLPSQWYEVHIHLPHRSIHGITMPGFPGLIAAYNGQTAWSVSRTPVDQIDFFHLEVTPDHRQYRYGSSWKNFTEQTHTIPSREGGSTRHTTLRTEHGPVLYLDNYGIAMQWNLLKNPVNPANLWQLLDTQTTEDINRKADTWQWPVVQLSSADREGNIASRLVGKQPVRNNAIGLQSGADTTLIWNRYSTGSQLPSVSNPTNGHLIYTGQNPSVDNRGLYLGYNWPKSWQKQRIQTLINSRERHNADQVSRILMDVELPFRFFLPIIERNRENLAGTQLRELADEMGAWDFRAEINSDLPILFDSFLRIFKNNLYGEINPVARPSDRVWYYYLMNEPNHMFFNREGTGTNENASDVVIASLSEAFEITRIEYGTPNNWLWSSANRLRIAHTSDAPTFRVMDHGTISRPGFNGTVNPAPSRTSTTASTMRLIFDFGSSDQAIKINHLGSVTEDPLNAHYNIPMNAWLNGDFRSKSIRSVSPEQSISNITIKATGR